MQRIYTFLILVGLFALGLVTVSAGVVGPGYSLEFTDPAPEGNCNEITVGFRFGNEGRPWGGTMDVTLTVTGPAGLVVTETETFAFDYEADPPHAFIVTLADNLTSGATYKVAINTTEVNASTTFVAGGCGGSEDSSKSKPVELPPCEIEDTRLDEGCGTTFVVTYAQAREDGCYISIYSVYGRADRKPVLVLQATPGEIAAAQASGDNTVIDSADVVNLEQVTIYWLSATGEFQVNAGPNEEGKVYVLNFTGCPATNIYTSNSYQEAK